MRMFSLTYRFFQDLNQQFAKWISQHVEKNPLVLLTPVLKDYENHLKEIQAKDKQASDGKATSPAAVNPKTIFSSKPEADDKSSSSPSLPAADPKKPLLGAFFGKPVVEAEKEKEAPVTSSATSTTPSSSLFSFGSSKPPTGTFSFGSGGGATSTSATTTTSSTGGFSFGAAATAATTTASASSLGAVASSGDSANTTSSGAFSFGTKPAAAGTEAAQTKPAFSFGSSSSGTEWKPSFSFGSPPAQTAATANVAKSEEEEEEDEPPKVEVKTVVEDGASYSVRCKLYYKKDKEFKDRGVGMLHLKPVNEGDKTQLVVRAETNLGNVLLNVLVNDKMMFKQAKNNIQFVCVPNPEIKGVDPGPTSMLFKVKDAPLAEELLKKLQEATG